MALTAVGGGPSVGESPGGLFPAKPVEGKGRTQREEQENHCSVEFM